MAVAPAALPAGVRRVNVRPCGSSSAAGGTGVDVGVGVDVAVGVGVGVTVAVAVAVGVSVGVGVCVAEAPPTTLQPVIAPEAATEHARNAASRRSWRGT
jgi:hypothetical protein